MGRSRFDPGYDNRRPWNAGRLVGAKRPFKVKQIWAIRFYVDHEKRFRDRALLDLAVDSKLRGCDLVKLKIGDVVSGGAVKPRATIVQQKTGKPFNSKLSSRRAQAFSRGSKNGAGRSMISSFPAAVIHLATSARDNMRGLWMSG